jgi:hypothetical protein
MPLQGASSVALGPPVRAVSQSFVDEVRLFVRGYYFTRFSSFIFYQVRYINRVELVGGLVKIELHAERKVLSESKVRV